MENINSISSENLEKVMDKLEIHGKRRDCIRDYVLGKNTMRELAERYQVSYWRIQQIVAKFYKRVKEEA